MWQPTISNRNLQKRAEILAQVRRFFSDRGVLEVETPLLAHAPVTDPYLEALTAQTNGKTLYLQTSPEYAMKRLLAAGSGDIYQICKAFRQDEQGRLHNAEFTMLEWYRIGFDDQQLMQEVSDLCQMVLQCEPVDRLSYAQAFHDTMEIDPHSVKLPKLTPLIQEHYGVIQGLKQLNKTTALQLLFSEVIEPQLGQHRPVLIYDYPLEQAALAKVDAGIAKRFELYYRGAELANGYWELTDPAVQRQRFEQDLVRRQNEGLPNVPIDEKLLAALDVGLPECAGVALGLDRFIMLALNAKHIDEVMMC